MKKIGLLTCREMKGLLDYDRKLIKELELRGFEAEACVWQDGDIEKYDCLVFRTTWGYHEDIEKFRAFLDKIDRAGIPLMNPLHIIRKNLHKFYLKDMHDNGVDIIPTEFLKQGGNYKIGTIIKNKGWDKFIIKPAVSAGSYRTRLFSAGDSQGYSSFLNNVINNTDVLLQKYMPEIKSTGEWSTIFLSMDYHYTVLKTPREGDYRVQKDFGGIYSSVNPPAIVLETAKEIAKPYLNDCLYVRVDGVESNGKFYLMEVEMIEPDLYMNIFPEAIPVFANRIAEWAEGRPER